MGEVALLGPPLAVKTAVLVIRPGSESLLCPFFDKCDGVLLINAVDGSKEFHPCDCSSVKPAYELILKLQPRRLICGFIGGPERKMLSAAGIDVRLGSCSCSVDELVSSFSTLPKA
jgi:predicted Fe-Mo cluster-binding NifX family protein